MQDYSKLFRSRILVKQQNSKLNLIRRVIRSGVSQSLMLAAVVLVVEGVKNR